MTVESQNLTLNCSISTMNLTNTAQFLWIQSQEIQNLSIYLAKQNRPVKKAFQLEVSNIKPEAGTF